MRINRHLYQFPDQTTLLFVAGNQEAKIYMAGDGQIQMRAAFQTDRPRYTDNEGFYRKDGRGQTARTGAVREIKRQTVTATFLHALKGHLKSAVKNQKIKDAYVFAPKPLQNEIRRAFPAGLQKKIRGVFNGDFCKSHPFELIAKIERHFQDKRVVPIRKETKSILERQPPSRPSHIKKR